MPCGSSGKKKPKGNDVSLAFRDLLEILNAAPQTTHIIVDITSNPQFQTGATISGALAVQRHRQMGKWLVIGTSSVGQFISRALMSLGKHNIEWFDTEEEAMAHLATLTISGEQ